MESDDVDRGKRPEVALDDGVSEFLLKCGRLEIPILTLRAMQTS
jgi:hypothetical protein